MAVESLNCGNYEIYIAERGGTPLTCRLTPNSIKFNRTINDFSEATVVVPIDAACRECLSYVNPWQHELLIFRAGVMVWCGPIQTLEYDPTSSKISVYARDLMAWTEKRLIEPLNGIDYDVEEVDVREVFEWVLNHAYAKGPWRMAWSLTDTGIPISRFYPAVSVGEKWGGTYRNVSSELRALSQIGVDFTVINRYLIGGDLEINPPISGVLKISDNNWAQAPKILVNGTPMSTRTIVAGGSGGFYGWYEDQIWIEEDYAPWGLLETFTERNDLGDEDTTQTPNAITQEAYSRHMLLRQPLAVISGGQLANDAPFTFETLIPGVPISVGFLKSLRDIDTEYRLYSVDVDVTETETINLRLSSPGSSEVRL